MPLVVHAAHCGSVATSMHLVAMLRVVSHMLIDDTRRAGRNSVPTDQGESDVLDAVQMPGRHQVHIDRSRDALLTDFGRATLSDRYLMPGEDFQDLFARVASYYGDDAGHAQRIYDYMSKLWFMPSTPVLSNGGTQRGLPISCFLNEASDSLEGIVGLWNENVW
jgi:ribonucleotide reductase alpha subunit